MGFKEVSVGIVWGFRFIVFSGSEVILLVSEMAIRLR